MKNYIKRCDDLSIESIYIYSNTIKGYILQKTYKHQENLSQIIFIYTIN